MSKERRLIVETLMDKVCAKVDYKEIHPRILDTYSQVTTR